MINSILFDHILLPVAQHINMIVLFEFISSKLLTVWRRKARCEVVPTARTHELFQEINFYPSEKQSKFKCWKQYN